MGRGALGRCSVWAVFVFGVGTACTSIDDVGGGDSLSDPPAAPVLDQSIPTEVVACNTPGCRNILLVSGTKACGMGSTGPSTRRGRFMMDITSKAN